MASSLPFPSSELRLSINIVSSSPEIPSTYISIPNQLNSFPFAYSFCFFKLSSVIVEVTPTCRKTMKFPLFFLSFLVLDVSLWLQL